MKAGNRGPMLLGVLAVVLGALLWVAFSVSQSGALHASGREDGDAAIDARLGALPGAGAGIDRPVTLEHDARDVARAAALDAPGASAVQETELAPVPTLVGRVLAADGSPLAGARVLAAAGYDWFALPLDLEATNRRRRTAMLETTSAADGTFAFHDELSRGTLRLAIRAGGHRPRYEDALAIGDRSPTDLGDLRLTRGVVLAGRVVDRSGDGVAGAQLLQRIECGVAGMTKTVHGLGIPLGATDAQGGFRIDSLAAGPWRLTVDAPGFQVRQVEGRTAAAGEVQDELLFVLDPGAPVRGKLVGPPPELLERLNVQARVRTSGNEEEGGPGVAEDSPELPAGARRARRAVPGTDGDFEVTGLVPGLEAVLTVWETDEDGRPRRCSGFAPFVAWPGTSGVELVYRPAAVLAFQAVDARSGEPVTEFVAAAGFDHEVLLRDDDGQVVRQHPAGRARFEDLRPEAPDVESLGLLGAIGYVDDPGDVPRVSLWVRAVGHEPYSSEEIALEPGETRDLGKIRLEPQPVVRLVIVDRVDGEPVEGARAYLAKQGERRVTWAMKRDDEDGSSYGDRGFSYGVSDGSGRVVLSALPGEWTKLWVKSEGHAPYEDPDFYFDPSSEQERRIELSTGAQVHVVVRDAGGRPAPGSRVAHADLTSVEPESVFMVHEEGDVQADEEGVARFENLEPGTHAFMLKEQGGSLIVRSESLGDDWSQVELREAEVLELELEAPARGSLEGVLTENGAALAGATLRLDPGEEEGRLGAFRLGGATDPMGTFSDFDGSYRFPSVPCGSYQLLIDHAERLMTSALAVQIEPSGGELDIDLTVGLVEGRIAAPGGAPIEGATVRADATENRFRASRYRPVTLVEGELGSLEYQRGGSSRRSVASARNGRYTLRGVDTDQPIRVRVSARGYADDVRQDLKVAPGEIKRDVDFELDRAGWIRVSRSADTEGWILLSARLTGEDGQVLQTRNGWVGAGKTTELGSLKAGTWTVTARKRSDGETKDIGEKTVEVRVGEGSTLEF